MPDKQLLNIGRVVFGLAIFAFGVLCVVYADFVSALQPVPQSMPGYGALAVVTGVILLAIGLSVTTDIAAKPAATVAIVFFASWIALLHVPSAFLQPQLLRSPWWIRTFETLAVIGASVTLLARTRTDDADRWRDTGRVLYGVALPVFGVLHLIYPESVAALVPPWYPFPMFWAYFTGAAQFAAGLAIATGFLPRTGGVLAGTMYGMWALTLHIPRSWCRIQGGCDFLPGQVGFEGSRPGLTSLFVAVAMCGAAWIIAGSHEPDWDTRSE